MNFSMTPLRAVLATGLACMLCAALVKPASAAPVNCSDPFAFASAAETLTIEGFKSLPPIQ